MIIVYLESIDNHETHECYSTPMFVEKFDNESDAREFFADQKGRMDEWERLTMYDEANDEFLADYETEGR